jgi:uncharacterized damage-inducible protein DinB
MKKIQKPNKDEYALYYDRYIDLQGNDFKVLDYLRDSAKEMKTLILGLSEEQLLYRYEAGKWCMKDILMHIIDVERVFVYRAMRFARMDLTPTSFFEEDDYARAAQAHLIPTKKLVKEYLAQRNATISFFNNLTLRQLKAKGIAGNTTTSVRALAWIIAGHQIHHLSVIHQKYITQD